MSIAENFTDLISAFYFKVEINGRYFGFKSAKNIKLAMSFEPLIVGGMNDGPVMLPVPNKEGGRMTLERGKYKPKVFKLPAPGTVLQDMTISLYDRNKSLCAEYILNSAVVESVELGSLDAMTSEVVIEAFTVSFRSISEKNY